MRLDPKACGLAGGILWGLGLLLLTWWLIGFGHANEATTELIGQVYLGYRVDFLGSFVGLFWGFVDGLCGGFAFAWLYNAATGWLASPPAS